MKKELKIPAVTKRHSWSGFTLIELMIVIAIIAILISLAVPRYSNYTVRSRISEGLALAAGAKVAVAEYVMATGSWPNDNANAGLPSTISSKYVSDLQTTSNAGGGQITITYDVTTIPELSSNNLLVLNGTEQNGSINWSCNGSANTIDNNYLPPQCRP